MKRSQVVTILLTSTTLLAGCGKQNEYKSVQDCVAAGYRIEQCQPHTYAGGGGGSNSWLWYWMGRNSGTTYVPVGSPSSPAIVSTARPAASAPVESAPAASARGGFGTTGAAHAAGGGE